MKKVKTYIVDINYDFVWKAKKELKAWGSVNVDWCGNSFKTRDKQAIDIITETFIDHPHLYKIAEEN